MPSLKHNTASCTPNLSILGITTTVYYITVEITDYKSQRETLTDLGRRDTEDFGGKRN
jgi:hypothetical protein